MKCIEPLECRRLLVVTYMGDLNTTPSQFSTALAPEEISGRGSMAIFNGMDLNVGREPWISDGTPGGTRMLIDLAPGITSSDPEGFRRIGENWVFEASPSEGSRALYFTDGTVAGTRQLVDVLPNSQEDNYWSFMHSGSLLYFNVRMSDTRYDLWRTDGTAEGTFQLRNLNNGFAVSMATIGGLAHIGIQGGIGGTLVSDGTVGGTTRSALYIGLGIYTTNNYIWTGLNGLVRYSIGATNITSVISTWTSDSRLLHAQGENVFVWNNGGLYVGPETSTDPTTFRYIMPSTNITSAHYMSAVGNTLYLIATPVGETNACFYTINVVTRRAELLTSPSLFGGAVEVEGALGGKLVFSTEEASRTRLWTTDGTAAGTSSFKTIRGMSGDAAVWGISVDRLFFTANDGLSGTQLWVSDATNAGTLRLTDLQATESSSPRFVELPDGKLVGAANTASGRELWLSNGTPSGTRMYEISPGIATGIRSSVTVVNGHGYFVASDGSTGLWLWETDGTEANTRVVTQLETNSTASTLLITGGTRSVYVETRFGTTVTLRRYDTQTAQISVEHTQISAAQGPLPVPLLWADRLLFERTIGTSRSVLISAANPGTAPQVLLAGVTSTAFLPFADETALEAGKLYLATTVAGQRRFWSTNGTPAGTSLASTFDLTSVAGLIGITTENGAYFSPTTFGANPPQELHFLDGTTGQVKPPTDVTGTGTRSAPTTLIFARRRLVFVGYDGITSSSRSLYVLNANGTTATRLAAVSTSAPNAQTVGNVVLFTGADGELWKSDLTAAGTSLLVDLSPYNYSMPTVTPLASGRAFVAANHIAYGIEGWIVDDSFAPRVLNADFDPDAFALRVRFDERIELNSEGISIINLATGERLPSDQYQISIVSTATRSDLAISLSHDLPDSNWRLSLEGIAISDLAGNLSSDGAVLDFFILAGDINRDRAVNFDDLLILAQNYGQSGRTYSQGNVNYSADGKVDFDDLLILAQQYGSSLFSTSAITLPTAKKKSTTRAAELLN